MFSLYEIHACMTKKTSTHSTTVWMVYMFGIRNWILANPAITVALFIYIAWYVLPIFLCDIKGCLLMKHGKI